MVTQAFIPKSELIDWLRQAVRHRENVAVKIFTHPQRDTLTIRLSNGRLVNIASEGRSPLDALVLLAECDEVKFSYSSVRASERGELMSSAAFLKWLDSVGDAPPSEPDAGSDLSSRVAHGERWSGTLRGGKLRGGQARKGGAAGVVALAGVVAVVGVLAAAGFYLTGGDLANLPEVAGHAAHPGRTGAGGRRAGAELVAAPIAGPTTWQAGRTYRLDGLVFVESGARLVIEPGVIVVGGPGAALIVTQDATIQARGTSTEPIVFTSAKPEGERASGDWGGVVLLGDAPINRGQASVEGIARGDWRATFGGGDPASSCGVLEYVRIEFAGHPFGANNELNGLTLGGCGSGTLVRYVQVHRSSDDGIEILGGTVDLKYVFVSHAGADSFDWDMGWTGRSQFVVIQQHPDMGDSGLEGNNWRQRPSAPPISKPRFHNVTMVGSRNPDRAQRAIVVRHGSGGEFRNFVITGFPLEAIDLRGELTARRIASKTLSFGSIVMSKTGPDGVSYFTHESGTNDDDGGFDERHYFSEIAPDVLLAAPDALGPEAFDLVKPDFRPVAAYVGAGSRSSPPANDGFWDEAASYYGAVRYGERASWLHGWTACPED